MSKELDDMKRRLDELESRQNESRLDKNIRQLEEAIQSGTGVPGETSDYLHKLRMIRDYGGC